MPTFKLSREGASADFSEHDPSRLSTCALNPIWAKKELLLNPKKPSKNESLANHCVQRPPMLYYRGSRLKGKWNPSGTESLVDSHKGLHLLGLKGKWNPSGTER